MNASISRSVGSLLLLLLLIGCTPKFTPTRQQKQQSKLTTLLIQTQPQINHSEASTLAHEAIVYSQKLASQYQVSTPPLLHNFLVNIRLKDRGLCYQWSDDLYRHLQQFHFKSIRLLPVGAYIGSYWREHNAIVVLPAHSNHLKEGILLDAWRASGKLYFIPITQDPDYHWQIRTDRCDVYSTKTNQNGR